MRKDEAMDMCEGPLFGKLLVFAVPLMFSGILQLLFNAADIIVVGQFTGDAAMAAVGSTSSLNNLIVNFFLGLSAGASVAAARYYGMGAWRDVEGTVHTAILLGLITGLAMVFIGFFLARPLLTLMGTTSDVIDQSVLYMRIVFVGMPALMVYDFGAGILRAIGASKRNVASVFNAETFIEGLISGVFAIAVVVGVSVPVNAWVAQSFAVENIMSLPWQSAAALVCVSVALTLVAGLIPSSAASRRDPVEALRSE